MITRRPANERGHVNFGWLDSHHTFSFGEYHDPRHMGFRALRVINEDRVREGKGFGTHGHRDMEIVSYVLGGQLEHKDSLGTGSVLVPGDVQRMTAGTGVLHSEFNPSSTAPVHFLQIWVLPERPGLAPGYEQKNFPAAERSGRLRLVADRHGTDGAITVHQDVRLYAGLLAADTRVSQPIAAGRHAWVQVARGAVSVNGERLDEGDGAALSEVESLEIGAEQDAEVLVFDLA
ncbi:MAG: pirin family protein [Deltaproteobacteria bacterium]|nr:pirin family protein [Deltaproteobacteria bacterium]